MWVNQKKKKKNRILFNFDFFFGIKLLSILPT